MFPAHTNKIFTCRFTHHNPNVMYSGSWDQQVKFWDVRANKMTHNIGGVQICGDAVDITRDMNLVVTGGGSKGEGVKLWDFRDTSKPLKSINWNMSENGQKVNPLINCCKFVPGQNLILIGANDSAAAKCFNYCTGEVVEKFSRVEGTCFTLDVSDDATLCCFGDGSGQVHFENINYTEM